MELNPFSTHPFHLTPLMSADFQPKTDKLSIFTMLHLLETEEQVSIFYAGTNFSNAVLDRVNFEKANLQGAVFKNTVLSGSTFNDAQLQDADFEDTIIGYIDLQKLCVNKTINDEERANLGCR